MSKTKGKEKKIAKIYKEIPMDDIDQFLVDSGYHTKLRQMNSKFLIFLDKHLRELKEIIKKIHELLNP